jgi:hypothetical protein
MLDAVHRYFAGSPLQQATVVVLMVIGVALGLLGVGLAQWYSIDEPTVLVANIGLFRSCTTVGLSAIQVCSPVSFDDISVVCGKDGAAMLSRVRSLRATCILGPIFVLLSLAFGTRRNTPSWAIWTSIICGSIGVLFLAFVVSWSVYLFDSWYYCGNSYCYWRETLGASGACSSTMGASWYLVIGGLIAVTLGLIALVARLVYRLRLVGDRSATFQLKHAFAVAPMPVQWDEQDALPEASPSPPTAHAPDFEPECSRPPPPTSWPDFSKCELDDDNALPDGEWIKDGASGLYWSNEEQLYVHLESGMFFDPHSQMWFDSQANEWIN